MADPITRGIDEYWLVMGGFEPDTTDAIAAACRAAIAADRALNAAPAQPAERASSHAIALALIRPECDRLREWASIGPVQRAAVESFADAIVAGAGAERAPSVGAEGLPPLPASAGNLLKPGQPRMGVRVYTADQMRAYALAALADRTAAEDA